MRYGALMNKREATPFVRRESRVCSRMAAIAGPTFRQSDVTCATSGGARQRYACFGVREYWLVDPDAQSITVYVAENEQFIERGTATGTNTVPSVVVAGYMVDAAVIFR